MSEALYGVVAALAALGGVGLRELTHRRQRKQKLTAEASVDEATALATIAETAKGLLVTMSGQLKIAQEEVATMRDEVRQLRTDLDVEKERTKALTAEVAQLEARLVAAGQENP